MSADAVAATNEVDVHEEDVHDANYQPPPEKTIEEIMAADQEDESLRRYKETLLGEAQAEKIIVGKIKLYKYFLYKKNLKLNIFLI